MVFFGKFIGANDRAKARARRNWRLHAEPLERREMLSGDGPIISEFMASNEQTTLDQFGLTSDWIELFNPTDAPISLVGWHLTNDREAKDKWTFPDVTIERGQFMVV